MKILKFILFVLLFIIPFQELFAQSYFLIVSSHKSVNTANQEVDKLKASGFIYANYLFNNIDNQFRVYLNEYASKDLAQKDAKKYERKFKDAWILQSKSLKTEPVSDLDLLSYRLNVYRKDINSASQEIDSLKSELRKAMLNLNSKNEYSEEMMIDFQQRIESLGSKIGQIDAKYMESIQEMSSLKSNMNILEADYVRKNDTVNVALESLEGKFDFGRPRLSVDLGLFRSEVISNFNSTLLSYFDIANQTVSNNFFGLTLGSSYHLTEKWNLGIDINSYYYLHTFYFFPSLGIKLEQQLGNAQLKLIPSLNIGTDVLFLSDGSIKGLGYFLVSPGLNFEFGITKNFSLISTNTFNYGIANQLNGVSTDIQHFNHTIGIRFNILQKRSK